MGVSAHRQASLHFVNVQRRVTRISLDRFIETGLFYIPNISMNLWLLSVTNADIYIPENKIMLNCSLWLRWSLIICCSLKRRCYMFYHFTRQLSNSVNFGCYKNSVSKTTLTNQVYLYGNFQHFSSSRCLTLWRHKHQLWKPITHVTFCQVPLFELSMLIKYVAQCGTNYGFKATHHKFFFFFWCWFKY